MSTGDVTAAPLPPATSAVPTAAPWLDVPGEARELVAGLSAHPWGQASASVYETGRLVSLAPWLGGHAERLAFLIGAQRPDGGWGFHDDYALVPTLSATEAMLSELGRETGDARDAIAAAAGRGLRTLFGWARQGYGLPFPDMPAIELIVPSLVGAINEHLTGLGDAPAAGGLRVWVDAGALPLPAGMGDAKLAAIRSGLLAGAELPMKLLHALEVAGDAAARAPGVRPTAAGTIGASPAATAAWLGAAERPTAGHPARLHLESVAERYGGPVPVGVPITVFERGWVLSWLRRAGVPVEVPQELVAGLRDGLGPAGVPAGPGLPEDADTTSVALYALALLGAPQEPESLWRFHTGTHFCTWHGEQGSSTTVNAHVLDAFGEYVARRPDAPQRYVEAMVRLSGWIGERQEDDGRWTDRWHASPYYATACCALALDEFGGEESARAVRRAVRWVLSTQRADGSWGLWRGTAEETAYALQILLRTRVSPGDPARREAVARGHARLLRAGARSDDPPMWHDKDLYLPVAIIRAAVLGAIHLAQSDHDIAPHSIDNGAKHKI